MGATDCVHWVHLYLSCSCSAIACAPSPILSTRAMPCHAIHGSFPSQYSLF